MQFARLGHHGKKVTPREYREFLSGLRKGDEPPQLVCATCDEPVHLYAFKNAARQSTQRRRQEKFHHLDHTAGAACPDSHAKNLNLIKLMGDNKHLFNAHSEKLNKGVLDQTNIKLANEQVLKILMLRLRGTSHLSPVDQQEINRFRALVIKIDGLNVNPWLEPFLIVSLLSARKRQFARSKKFVMFQALSEKSLWITNIDGHPDELKIPRYLRLAFSDAKGLVQHLMESRPYNINIDISKESAHQLLVLSKFKHSPYAPIKPESKVQTVRGRLKNALSATAQMLLL